MTIRFVTLASFTELHEAQSASQTLKEAGIPAYVRGEANAMLAGNASASSIKIEVAEEDLEFAQRVFDVEPNAENIPTLRPAPPDSSDREGARNRVATVEVFYDLLDAEHAASCLRKHGIPHRLHGDSSGALPGLGAPFPSRRLDVLEEDLERACGLLGFVVEGPESDCESGIDAGHIMADRGTFTRPDSTPADSTRVKPVPGRPQVSPADKPLMVTDVPCLPSQSLPTLEIPQSADLESRGPRRELILVGIVLVVLWAVFRVIKMISLD